MREVVELFLAERHLGLVWLPFFMVAVQTPSSQLELASMAFTNLFPEMHPGKRVQRESLKEKLYPCPVLSFRVKQDFFMKIYCLQATFETRLFKGK